MELFNRRFLRAYLIGAAGIAIGWAGILFGSPVLTAIAAGVMMGSGAGFIALLFKRRVIP